MNPGDLVTLAGAAGMAAAFGMGAAAVRRREYAIAGGALVAFAVLAAVTVSV